MQTSYRKSNGISKTYRGATPYGNNVRSMGLNKNDNIIEN